MKTSYAASIAFSIVALTASHAMAADQSVQLTREQVRAELLAAQRSGNFVASDDLSYTFGGAPGMKQNELFPSRYATKAVLAAPAETSGKTRAQVQAEAVESLRTGNVAASDDLSYTFGGAPGMKLNELFPGSYAAKSAVTTKSTN